MKYILSGSNLASEAILPFMWSQGHRDWKYIRSVCIQNGASRFDTFPHYTLSKYIYYTRIKKINWISLLDYYFYNKEESKKLIEEKFGWCNYGRKHGESNYTKIFQEYILPTKFGYDKRRAHLSSLIVAGQLSRTEALDQLKEPLYKEKYQQEDDIAYLVNKLCITREQFEEIIKMPPKTMHDYANMEDSWYYKVARVLFGVIKRNKK